MELGGIGKADVVRCELRGVTFFAFVLDRDETGLSISVLERHKLPRGLVVSTVKAHQVTGHWAQRSRRRSRRRATDCEPVAVPA